MIGHGIFFAPIIGCVVGFVCADRFRHMLKVLVTPTLGVYKLCGSTLFLQPLLENYMKVSGITHQKKKKSEGVLMLLKP